MSQNYHPTFGGGNNVYNRFVPQDQTHQHSTQYSGGVSNSFEAQSQRHVHPISVEQQMNPATAQGGDISALAGISPTIIARLIQSGMLQIPPMQLPMSAATTISAAAPASNASESLVTQRDRPFAAADHASVGGAEIDMDMDISSEDGELHEEAHKSHAAPSRPFGQASTTRKPSEHGLKTHEVGRTAIHDANSNGTTTPVNGPQLRKQESAAEEFVVEMVKAGYTFEQLASHVRHRESLRRLFAKLGLDKPAAAERQTKGENLPRVAPLTKYMPQTTSNPTDGTHKSGTLTRSAPAKAPPVNRKDYLARLQAAKTKKSGNQADDKIPSSSALPPSKPTITASLPIKPAAPSGQITPVTKADKDRLLRERLAAVKAEVAAKKAAKAQPPFAVVAENPHSASNAVSGGPSSDSSAATGSPVVQHDVSSAVRVKTNPQEVAIGSPHDIEPHVAKHPEAFQRSLLRESSSGLPGLFMQFSPRQETAKPFPDMLPASPSGISSRNKSTTVTIDSQTSSSNTQAPISATDTNSASKGHTSTRKRPVASDFNDFAARKSPAKRLFGQSRSTSGDESIVIENSEDEDEDEEMASTEAPLLDHTKPATKSFRDFAPLRDFRMGSETRQQTSYPGTPGVATPNSLDYQRMVQDIEEMNRKIAALEKRKLVAKSGSSGLNTIQAPTADTNVSSSAPVSTIAHPDIDMPTAPFQAQPSVSLDSSPSDSPGAINGHPTDTAISGIEDPRPAMTVISQGPANEVEDASTIPGLITLSGPSHVQSVVASPVLQSMQIPATGEDAATSESTMCNSRVASRDVEEGEVSDESVSNFYGAEPARAQRISGSPPPGSQRVYSTNDDMPDRLSDTFSSTSSESEMQISDSDSDMSDGEIRSISEPFTSSALPADAEGHINSNTEEAGSSQDRISFQTREREISDHHTVESSDDASTGGSTMDTDEYEPQPTSDDGDVLDRSLDGGADVVPETQFSMLEASIDLSGTDDNAQMSYGGTDLQQTEPALEGTQVREDANIAASVWPTDHKQATSPRKAGPTGYVSALSKFKNFRFHPQYLQFVQGGYRSLTYNHKIDATQPICQYEVVGGVCNDGNCLGQHFESMQLSGKFLFPPKDSGDEGCHVSREPCVSLWN